MRKDGMLCLLQSQRVRGAKAEELARDVGQTGTHAITSHTKPKLSEVPGYQRSGSRLILHARRWRRWLFVSTTWIEGSGVG